MGSGDKFTYGIMEGWGFGIHYYHFPFEHTITINLIKFHVTIGFGKGYDE